MNVPVRSSPEETRERILTAAEELFRRIGYYKTTVGDIAQALGMSSANIYRFFPSKNGIVEGLCAKILGALLAEATAAANAPGAPSQRVFNVLIKLHRHHRDHLTN